VTPDNGQSFNVESAVTSISDQPLRSVMEVPVSESGLAAPAVDVPAPATDVVAPAVNAAAPVAGGSQAAASAPVAKMPAAGIGVGGDSGSIGSLLLTIASGLSALGALRTRKSWSAAR
jgi:hypothetical protein